MYARVGDGKVLSTGGRVEAMEAFARNRVMEGH